MRYLFLFFLSCIVSFVSGCSKSDDMSKTIIDQQKVNLDALKQNQETLDKIHKKEKALEDQERKNVDTLKELEEKKNSLAKLENELNNKTKEVNDKIKSLNELNNEIQQGEKKRAYIAKIAEDRIPYLDDLSRRAAVVLQSWAPLPTHIQQQFDNDILSQKYSSIRSLGDSVRNETKDYWLSECAKVLKDSDVIHIESDDVFKKQAIESIKRVIKFNVEINNYETAIKYFYTE